ncbi:hypothetical protein LZ30DRAFT_126012 [Colletotrichum cereale]|nr:hypothetical protein LZ30DRAFT_126012 [Colletotrichum cereale]
MRLSLGDTLNLGGKGRGVERGGEKKERQETQTGSWKEESGSGVPASECFTQRGRVGLSVGASETARGNEPGLSGNSQVSRQEREEAEVTATQAVRSRGARSSDSILCGSRAYDLVLVVWGRCSSQQGSSGTGGVHCMTISYMTCQTLGGVPWASGGKKTGELRGERLGRVSWRKLGRGACHLWRVSCLTGCKLGRADIIGSRGISLPLVPTYLFTYGRKRCSARLAIAVCTGMNIPKEASVRCEARDKIAALGHLPSSPSLF